MSTIVQDRYFEESVRPHSYNDIVELAKEGKDNLEIASIVAKKYVLTIDYPLRQIDEMIKSGVLIDNCANSGYRFGRGTTFTVKEI